MTKPGCDLRHDPAQLLREVEKAGVRAGWPPFGKNDDGASHYEATLTGGLGGLRLDPGKILEARLFRPGELPAGMPQVHRELIAPR